MAACYDQDRGLQHHRHHQRQQYDGQSDGTLYGQSSPTPADYSSESPSPRDTSRLSARPRTGYMRPKSAGRTRGGGGAVRRSSLKVPDDDVVDGGIAGVGVLGPEVEMSPRQHRQVVRTVSDSSTRAGSRNPAAAAAAWTTSSDTQLTLVDDVNSLRFSSNSSPKQNGHSPPSTASKSAGFDILDLLSARQRVLDRYDVHKRQYRVNAGDSVAESADPAKSYFDSPGGSTLSKMATMRSENGPPANVLQSRRVSLDGRQTRLEPLQVADGGTGRRRRDWVQQVENFNVTTPATGDDDDDYETEYRQ